MEAWWKTHPWRMIQTNLREIDMLDIDAEEYVKQMLDFGATIAMINVGGIIASYETDLSEHYQSPYLKGDSLSAIIEACHEAGLRVVARMDFSKIRRPVYERHPEWAYRRADGQIVDYNGNIHACICGGYQQEYTFKILEEALQKLPVDGVFFNMGGFVTSDYSHRYHGFCHCDNCKRLFRQQYGYEIPQKEDMGSSAYRAYTLFRESILKDYSERLKTLVRSINPDIAINGEDFYRMESNTEYRRKLPFWQYSSSSNTRAARGISQVTIPSNATVDFIGFFYRHVAVSEAQQKLRLYQSLANLGGLDYYLIGRLDNHCDRTGFQVVKDVFRFHKEHEADYFGLRSVADILLLRSSQWGGLEEELGWIRALTESHFLFDEAMVSDLRGNHLGKYGAIIVPSMKKLPDEIVAAMDAFVSKGGFVIVSGMSGEYTDTLEDRDVSRFECLGIEKYLYQRDDMVSSMLLKNECDFPLFTSMKNTDVLMAGDSYIYAEYRDNVEKYLSLIPPHDFGPPERCYYTQVTGQPGIAVNCYGKGKGLFIPWQPGVLYYREGYENTLFFLKDVLQNIAGITPVGGDISEMVEVTVSECENHALVQFVNTSGHFGTSYMRPIPIHNMHVELPYARAREVTCATSLVDGRDIKFSAKEGCVSLDIETINDFGCVKLCLK